MRNYNIGLDFGTYQSKACVYDVDNDVHEFFVFPTSKSFFLPSRVAERNDGTFEYGNSVSGLAIREYYYFKMAAAEDEEFREETSTNTNPLTTNFYDPDKFKPYTPEFLVTTFLTYMLLTIKEAWGKKKIKPIKKGSFLSRLFDTQIAKEEEIKMTIQLGIPTEWSHKKNLKRKRKFQNILLISEFLQNKYKTLENYLNQKVGDLIEDIEEYYRTIKFNSLSEFNSKLNSYGLSVWAETAAGLTFITQTKQLTTGYYAIMDIGGGTTDISFFRLMDNGVIKYIASEAYMMAANNVYSKLLPDKYTTDELYQMESEIRKTFDEKKWKENSDLRAATKYVRSQLQELFHRLFAKRVYWFHSDGMRKRYGNQSLIVYGGGFEIPEILTSVMLIHDNGVKSKDVDCTYMEVIEIEKFKSKINILPEDKTWEKSLSLLVVALGLSFIKKPGSADWFDRSDYHPEDGDPDKPVLRPKRPQRGGGSSDSEVPHPFNEGYYIYNVLASNWK